MAQSTLIRAGIVPLKKATVPAAVQYGIWHSFNDIETALLWSSATTNIALSPATITITGISPTRIATILPDLAPYLTVHEIDGRIVYKLASRSVRALDGRTTVSLTGGRTHHLDARTTHRRRP